MTEPVKLTTALPRPNPALVEMLESLLADARSGKIIGLVALTNDADGYRRWQSGTWSAKEALWLLEHWKLKALREEAE